MIRILKSLAVIAMSVALLVGCASTGIRSMGPAGQKQMCAGEIRNETSALMFLVVCIEPKDRPGECVGPQNVVLMPRWVVERYEKESGEKAPNNYYYKFTLEYGEYTFYLVSRDITTGSELKRSIGITVVSPTGQLIFRDQTTPVEKRENSVDV